MFSESTSSQDAGDGVTFPHFGYHFKAAVADSGEEMKDKLSASVREIHHLFQVFKATSCRSV